VANDVSQHPDYLPNPFLPQTQSEAALPLFLGQRLIGVLDVQHTGVDRFNVNEVRTLQIVASQLSVALANAELFAEQERLLEEVKAGRERLQALSHRLVEVQEAERRHIARELHDEVGQLLTGLKLTLDMSLRLPNEEIRYSLDEPQALVNELIRRVRELSLELRPAMLDDLGLFPTLLWHFERYTAQTRIKVKLEQSGLEDRRFAAATETAAFRIIQEALTNVARYADTTEVRVRLWLDGNLLHVQIQDDGAGFDLEATQATGSHSGLSGMLERAALLGGQLNIESVIGVGTQITGKLPLESPGG
jgi:signal transduction histidine kinase